MMLKMVMCMENSQAGGDEFEMPAVLRQLISVGGLCLVACPEGTWKFDGPRCQILSSLGVFHTIGVFCPSGVTAVWPLGFPTA